MSKALSQDLRIRVLAATADGLSSRQAALRFGVSAASAIRWPALERIQGAARPKALGGAGQGPSEAWWGGQRRG